MKIKPLYITIIAVLIIGIAVYFIFSPKVQPTDKDTAKEEPEQTGAVNIDKEKQKNAEITFFVVKKAKLADKIEANGVLEPDPSRIVKITSRVAGKVLKILANTGDLVSRGQPLILIDSIEVAQSHESYLQAKARLDLAKKNLDRQKKLAALGAFAKKPLQEADNKLMDDKSDLISATSTFELADKNLKRVKELFEDGISAKRDLEQAQTEYNIAKSELEKVKARVDISRSYYEREKKIYQMNLLNKQEIETAQNEYDRALIEVNAAKNTLNILGGGSRGSVYIRAPQGGVVDAREVTNGEAVDSSKTLMTIIDTSRLWAMISIYEKDAERIKVGAPCKITVNSMDKRSITGHIDNISPVLDSKSRTMKVRVIVDNQEGVLKPEMFLQAFITIADKETLFVPKTAVQRQDGEEVIYIVQTGDKFSPRKVKVGIETDKYYEILDGVKEGEKVVTSGSFNVKSELLKSTLEEE